MKTRKNHFREDGERKDVLKNLGAIIERQFKKGVSKMERLFDDSKSSDDTLFSYFKVFIDDKGVAAVTPSSKYMVERVLKAMDVKNAGVVVEYGAAGGVITRRILEE